MNVSRLSYECLATVVRYIYIHKNVVRHSHECIATVVRMSRDSREIYLQN